ncbi:right-handed parallel beta-helix repeat-containing protein [Parasphingorhabdus sp. DH2-15]|uniref:right-handed parallel beta-helix repeat-containing protein n=1 Tax=Parasphingorhabdus sp. DH2-15 TaxID=3444112 RepID=UPI003F682639
MRAKFVTSLLAITALAVTPFVATQAQSDQRGFTIAETGQQFRSLQAAVDKIRADRGTILIGPGRYTECAVQTAGYVIYQAAQPGSVVFDGGICEGKAAIVMRAKGAEVHGLIFENMAVTDLNGAGIRQERGSLTVTNSWFRNSQQGILTANDPTASLTIDKSTFTGLGRCGGAKGCAHSIYINKLASLKVTRSRFEKGTGGHYVKSRAPNVELTQNSFDDTKGTATNYMIDLPDGATGLIAGNVFVQGRNKENYSALIAVRAERDTWTSEGLTITNNDARIAPNVERNTVFVANWSPDRLNISNNTLDPRLKRYETR